MVVFLFSFWGKGGGALCASTRGWPEISHTDGVVSPRPQGEQWLFIPLVPEAFPPQGSSAVGRRENTCLTADHVQVPGQQGLVVGGGINDIGRRGARL